MPIHDVYKQLLDVLPMHAEEGLVREIVHQDDLFSLLAAYNGDVCIRTVLRSTRAVFEALSILDSKLLETNHWTFVSFPASLLGRSLLATLAVPGQRLFTPHFWEQGSHRPPADVEYQRGLLRELETRRQKYHPAQFVAPIRTVHVAWGIIKIREKFLLLHREDKSRTEVRNYVFPGGRLNLSDYPVSEQKPSTLRHLFDPTSSTAAAALAATLAREFEEEIQLASQNYSVERTRRLHEYVRVEGSENKHALTSYSITCFTVKLTADGELALLQHEARHHTDLVWFTAEEILNDCRSDGKRAFVDALKNDPTLDVLQFLTELPDSSGLEFDCRKETDAVDVPCWPAEYVLFGKTGKETTVRIVLSKETCGLLQLLVRHAKALPICPDNQHVCLLGNGWIMLCSPESKQAMKALQRSFINSGLPPPQLRREEFARVAVEPQHVYLSRDQFSYCLPEGDRDIAMMIELIEATTEWGHFPRVELKIDLPRNMVRAIRDIENGGDGDASNIKNDDLDRQIRTAFKPARQLGLRKFIYTENNRRKLAVTQTAEPIR